MIFKYFRNLFSKAPTKGETKKIISQPDTRFLGLIPGKAVTLNPQADITPYESAQLCNLMTYLILKNLRTKTNVKFDGAKFVADNNLTRHFKVFKNE